MTNLLDTRLSIAEAAFVADMPERAVQHEIDAQVLPARGDTRQRIVSGADVVYLEFIRDIRADLGLKLRQQMHSTIISALSADLAVATVATLGIQVKDLAEEVGRKLQALYRVTHDAIESKPTVLAGEPVIRGTRVPARLIVDLIKQGASRQEIEDDYDLTPGQIDAAIVFDRVTPRRGRPATRKLKIKQHVPAAR